MEYAKALFRALPTLFPSPTAPLKKLGHASEALLHVLLVRLCSHFVTFNTSCLSACMSARAFTWTSTPTFPKICSDLDYSGKSHSSHDDFTGRHVLAFSCGPVFKTESSLLSYTTCMASIASVMDICMYIVVSNSFSGRTAPVVFLFYPKEISLFFLSSFSLANRRSHHLPPEEISLQPCFALWWVLLSCHNWNHPVTTFAKEDLSEGLLYLMAYYYTLHLTYPKCVATLLSVIQTEILQDTINEQDTTASYKRAMAEWKDFIGK